ncbi:MAG: hypothetical protein Q9194_001357 [Teloschistes cf. exilis]
MDGNNPDLESFRKEWREEVTARSKPKAPRHTGDKAKAHREKITASKPANALPPSEVYEQPDVDPVIGISAQAYHDLVDKEDARRLGIEGSRDVPTNQAAEEPKSALEHYEKAVEREDQGNLGDSVNLYRKAFRLDANVHNVYKKKHFPPSTTKAKTPNPNPSDAPVTVPNTAHHSLHGPSARSASISQLISACSTSSILASPPPTEGSQSPPCPIADIPCETLVQILRDTAIIDLASFARLSLVCRRLAYLVATEDPIWHRLCHGLEFGFAAMHYRWTCTVAGNELPASCGCSSFNPDGHLDISTLTLEHIPPPTPPLFSLSLSPAYTTYRSMLHRRPRVRFNGCYISTVNYQRPGVSSSSSSTFTSPILIVTYYRYLRFFRDGTCVSLCTTNEPIDVVHHLTKENMHSHHNRESTLPTAVMRHALRGRWKLSGSLNFNRTANSAGVDGYSPEGQVHVETEGVDPKYMYKMDLEFRSAGRESEGTRNNKLVWKGYWSHNRLTDDWAAFAIKKDRAFFWSRVTSYGMGW